MSDIARISPVFCVRAGVYLWLGATKVPKTKGHYAKLSMSGTENLR